MPPLVSAELWTVFRASRKNVTMVARGPWADCCWRRPQAWLTWNLLWDRGLGFTLQSAFRNVLESLPAPRTGKHHNTGRGRNDLPGPPQLQEIVSHPSSPTGTWSRQSSPRDA